MNRHFTKAVWGLAFSAVSLVVGVILTTETLAGAQTSGPEILTSIDSMSIIGACVNGAPNWGCSALACGGTALPSAKACDTQSQTCTDNGKGGCWIPKTNTSDFCGAPDSFHPKGCNDSSLSEPCALVGVITKAPIGGCGKANCIKGSEKT